MYPNMDLQQLLAMYRPQQMQFPQQRQQMQYPQEQQTQQQGGGSGMNLSSLKNMYNQFAGGEGGGGWGNLFGGGSPAVGGEAAPMGGVGSYAGAYPAAEGVGAGLSGLGEGAGAAGAGAAEGLGAAGAGAAEGLGAAAGGMGEGLMGLLALMFSDPKVKENKARVGQLYDGTPVWSYNYIGDHVPRIGLMADEVRPDAVYDIGGIKAVNYHTATEDARKISGLLGNLGA